MNSTLPARRSGAVRDAVEEARRLVDLALDHDLDVGGDIEALGLDGAPRRRAVVPRHDRDSGPASAA